MKYIIWRSPRGILNNRIYMNLLDKWFRAEGRQEGWKAWPLLGTSWHHVPCNLLFCSRTKDLGDELKCEVRGWNHKAGLLRASMLLEYKARDSSRTLH